jgi:hypothetical protein
MRYFIVATIAFLCGCCETYKLSKTDLKTTSLDVSCAGVVDLINSDLYVCKCTNRHLDNGTQNKLVNEYSECLKTFTMEMVKALLGEPNRIQENFFYYYFDEKCEKKGKRTQRYLRFGFLDGKVYFVAAGTLSRTH